MLFSKTILYFSVFFFCFTFSFVIWLCGDH